MHGQHLADQLYRAQQAGLVSDRHDPVRAADGLLAFTDGLSSHLLQDLHTPAEAEALLRYQLHQVFDRPT